jgi:hypothetical protein
MHLMPRSETPHRIHDIPQLTRLDPTRVERVNYHSLDVPNFHISQHRILDRGIEGEPCINPSQCSDLLGLRGSGRAAQLNPAFAQT